MKLKYGDKIIVIKDEENDGFYVGVEGIVKNYSVIKNYSKEPNETTTYQVEIARDERPLFFKEDQLQKI